MRLIDADALHKFFFKMHQSGNTCDPQDVLKAITNAPTVQRERWVSVPTDEMVKVLMVELLKINYLSHPDVPYEGTASGDSPDDWHRRVIKHVLTKTLQAAPTDTE